MKRWFAARTTVALESVLDSLRRHESADGKFFAAQIAVAAKVFARERSP